MGGEYTCCTVYFILLYVYGLPYRKKEIHERNREARLKEFDSSLDHRGVNITSTQHGEVFPSEYEEERKKLPPKEQKIMETIYENRNMDLREVASVCETTPTHVSETLINNIKYYDFGR